jgi:hypothetical protein
MSLDNGTLVIKLKKTFPKNGMDEHEYFVGQIHAFRNIFKCYAALDETLKTAHQFDNENDARQHAIDIERGVRSEHGSCFVDTFADNTVLDIGKLRRIQEDDKIRHLL